MSRLTRRKQIRIDSQNQLFHPEQLESEMHIALAGMVMPARHERLFRAAAAFTGFIERDEDQGRLQAVRRGWRDKEYEGLLPLWRGIIDWRNADGVMVLLTGIREDSNDEVFFNRDPSELPDVPQPECLFASYSSLGLKAIDLATARQKAGLGASDIGRWQPSVTLRLT
jgi:hypothetical protein